MVPSKKTKFPDAIPLELSEVQSGSYLSDDLPFQLMKQKEILAISAGIFCPC
jgi:hypothetical protein